MALRLIAKRNIAAVLRRELAEPSDRPNALLTGAATDGDQPIERGLRLTRAVIEVLAEARHPFSSSPSAGRGSAIWTGWRPWLRTAPTVPSV